MMKSVFLLIILVSSTLLTGCTHFTAPMEQPVIQKTLSLSSLHQAQIGTLSLTPDRRVVLANFFNGRFCAEAPTEVGVDMSKLIKIATSVSKGSELKAGLDAISAAATSNSILNKRTQGMQLFMANAYFICQMYMNGAINEFELIELQLETLNAVAPLIELEIPLMYKNQPEVANNVSRSYVPLDINKVLEDIGKQNIEPIPEE